MSALISRQVVLDLLQMKYSGKELYKAIYDLPSAFDGMTNGEVIQAIFDVMVLTVKDGKVWVERIFFPFDEIWWNAPYQKGGE